jgi:uncharacterized repeat protein (TIGR03803 family)
VSLSKPASVSILPILLPLFLLSGCGGGGSESAPTGSPGTGAAPNTPVVARAPTLSFSASPTSLPAGSTTRLTWSSTDATSCIAGRGWTGSKAVSASEVVTVNQTSTFDLTCQGAGGQASQSVTVTAQPVASVLSTLHSFAPGLAGGHTPDTPLVQDASGNLYGTTLFGGAKATGTTDGGTVYRITPAGVHSII